MSRTMGATERGGDIVSSAVMLSLARLARMAQENELKAPLPTTAPQLVCLRSGSGSKAPLVLIHPVGGSVIPYRDLVSHISGGRPIYAIQSQSGVPRSSCGHHDIHSLAADYMTQVASIGLSNGVILGGYSLGGAVAFEMARQAADAGLKIERLLIIDTPAKIRALSADTETPITINQLLTFSQMLAAARRQPLKLVASDIEAVPEERRIHHVIAKLRELQVIGDGVADEVYHDIYRLVRHNERLQRDYRPGCYNGEISLVRTLDEAPLLREEVGAIYDRTDFGWGDHCTGKIRLVRVPGSHLQLLYQPFILGLAKAINLLIETPETGIAS